MALSLLWPVNTAAGEPAAAPHPINQSYYIGSYNMSPSVKVLFFASAREAAGGITSASVNIDSDEDTKKFR